MTDLLTAALAAFVVELAKSAGHETGIRILAALGPHLTAEQVGRAWTALVAAAQRAVGGEQQALADFFASPEWSQPNGPPLDPGDPTYTAP